ncbi:RNA polymerase sigma factor [Planctomycetota bacterium]
MLEDRLLIWKFNRGRSEVLRRIYAKYKDEMNSLACAFLYDRDAAEDVVHDVFVAFIRSCGRLRLTRNLKGYLMTCVANHVRNRNKAGQRQGVSLEPVISLDSQNLRPDQAVLFSERSQQLAEALAKLPEVQREVLLLHLYSGLSFKAIAEIQEISANTVHGRYRYGLTKLRSILNGKVIQ